MFDSMHGTSDGSWDLQLLTSQLPAHALDKIQAIPSPSPFKGEDIVPWIGSTDGNFKMSQAYHSIVCGNSQAHDPHQKVIWKWEGLERIRFLL